MKKFTLLTLMLCTAFALNAQCPGDGLYVNEFSQGSQGNEDWVELLVVGNGNLNLNGWIFNDNDHPGSDAGNQDGYIYWNLANDASCSVLNSVPPGSIIIIYNETAKDPAIPADDPFDSNMDGVYIIPGNHICFNACTSGNPSTPAVYPCPTADISSSVSWGGRVSFRGNGDAPQTFNAAGACFSGWSYGDIDPATESPCMWPNVGSVGTATSSAFGCGTLGDVSLMTTQANSNATPGAANTVGMNAAFVANAANSLSCTDLEAAPCVPTMGTWAMIILTLSIISLSCVSISKREFVY